MKKYDRIDKVALVRHLRAGKSIGECAEILGRDYYSIYPAARRLGFAATGQRVAKLSLAQRRMAVSRYAAGDNVDAIAADLGVTAVTVYYHARAAGVKRRRPKYQTWTVIADREIRKMVRDLAASLGVRDRHIASRINQLYYPRAKTV